MQGSSIVKVGFGLYDHFGIYDGNGYVVHNSKKRGMVVREPAILFSEGKQIRKVSDVSHVVTQEALSLLGMPYNLLFSNCEQFVTRCSTGKSYSLQVANITAGVLALASVVYSKNPQIKSFSVLLLIAAIGNLISEKFSSTSGVSI